MTYLQDCTPPSPPGTEVPCLSGAHSEAGGQRRRIGRHRFLPGHMEGWTNPHGIK